MSTTVTTLVEYDSSKPGDSGTDWDRVNALTEEEIQADALADPDAQPLEILIAKGWKRLVNVKKLRERLGMTQEDFAKTYWIPLGTLRDWEQRRKNADRTAQAYLKVIDKDPKVVAALLGAE